MERFKEAPYFNIQETTQRESFENPETQRFFDSWCQINDSINPQFVTREEWNNLGTNILHENPDKSQNLYIPKDLKLWEMVHIFHSVDQKTFSNDPHLKIPQAKPIKKTYFLK